MKKDTYVHVSFDMVSRFVPRVPKNRAIGVWEDDATPRICVSTDIHHALLAVPQAGEVVRYMQMLGLPLVIHAYYLSSDKVYLPTTDEVPDAKETNERWLLNPPTKMMRRDYELADPLIIRHHCASGLEKYGIVSTGLRPARFQSNSENLKKALEIPDWNSKNFNEVISRFSFRTVIQVVGSEYEAKRITTHAKEGERIGREEKKDGAACPAA